MHLLRQVSEMCKWEEQNCEVNYHNPRRLAKSSFYFLPGKQVALHLFRYIFNSYFSFLFRTCTPLEMSSACDDVESVFKILFTSTFQLHPLSPLQWQQVFSPFRHGGLGFVPLSATSVAAFSASSHYFLHNNSNLLLSSSTLDSFSSSSSSLAISFRKAQSVVSEVIACAFSASSGSSSAPITSDSVNQHHIADFCAKQRRESFLSMIVDPVEKLRVSSLTATAIFVSIPSCPELLVSSPLVPIVLSRFLGLPFPRRLPALCLCGSDLDEQHLETCPHRAPQLAHNKLCAEISTLARQGGATVSGPSQISHLDITDRRVADFRISSPTPSSIDTIVDVGFRNTLAPSSFSSSSQPRPVLDYAAASKAAKHGPSSASISCNFSAFITDRFGNMGADAKSLFDRLVSQVPPDTFVSPNWAASSVSSYWHQRFSVCVWSSLARESLVFSVRASNAAASS